MVEIVVPVEVVVNILDEVNIPVDVLGPVEVEIVFVVDVGVPVGALVSVAVRGRCSSWAHQGVSKEFGWVELVPLCFLYIDSSDGKSRRMNCCRKN